MNATLPELRQEMIHRVVWNRKTRASNSTTNLLRTQTPREQCSREFAQTGSLWSDLDHSSSIETIWIDSDQLPGKCSDSVRIEDHRRACSRALRRIRLQFVSRTAGLSSVLDFPCRKPEKSPEQTFLNWGNGIVWKSLRNVHENFRQCDRLQKLTIWDCRHTLLS